MNKKKLFIWGLIFFIFSIVAIQYINYKRNVHVTSAAPSEKWSKDITLSKGFIKSNPSIITFKEEIYVAHTSENSISLVKTNKQGDIIDSKNYDFGKFMANVTFTKDKDNLYMSWNVSENGVRDFNFGVIDKELNIKDITVIERVNEIIKLSDEEMLISSGDNIKIIDNDLNVLFQSSKGNYKNLSADKYKDYIYISYYNENDGAFNVMTIKDNKKIKEENIVNIYKGIGLSFDNPVLNVNDDELVLIYEEFIKGEFRRTKNISYNLSDGNEQSNVVEINRQPVKGIIKGDSDGTFFGYVNRYVDKRFFEQDIVEFTIKDGNIDEYNFVSNSRNVGFYIANYEEYVVFCEFTGLNSHEVKLSSSENLIKESTSFVSKEEKKEAINISLEGSAYSFAYIFIIGITWIFLAFFIIGVISFLSYNFSDKMKKITYIGALVVVGLYQLYMINNLMYGKYVGLMPSYLSLGVGLGITLIIYLISGIFSYLLFKTDIEMIALVPFGAVLLCETFVVLSVFVPYIT